MTRSSDPTRPTTLRRRWSVRVLLAGLLAVGMAIAGLAFAAPANAKRAFIGFEVVSTADCDYANTGSVTLSATALVPGNSYQVNISTVAGELQLEESIAGDDLGDVTKTYNLQPGDYQALLLEQDLPSPEWNVVGNVTFTIGACLDLDVSVSTSCSTGADGSAMATFTGLIADGQYRYFVEGTDTSRFVPFTATGDSEDVVIADLPPGNFYVYVEWDGATQQGGVYDWRAFAIEPCQPDLTVTAAQCTVAGGTGTVDVALANLVDGVVYTVTGPDGTTQQAATQPSGVTSLTFPAIAAGTDSTVTVAGTWTVDQPYEEPPFLGGGDFLPLDTVALSASADVTLEPCPATVVPTGSGTTGLPATGLPATGAGDPVPPMAAALLLLALGGLTIALGRRRAAPTGR